ncbi:MAG: IS1182 family transposase [Chloroflexota bacterium]|nr:IS1182 family transposase [Chloroflexota bacterium]MBI5701908.1 IS1182 family transposase [Chloroflexota bacterium]
MAKYKPCNDKQMIMLPISLQDQLVPGSLEHTINVVVDEHLDLSVFDARYRNDQTGAAAIHPKILLKVILLAYAKGMLSSRQIERACRENVIFIALSYGYAPDHSTIAAFISSMQAEIESLFCNVLLVCEELNLLGGTHFALDGVKLSANVSKEWSGTFDELKRKRDKLQEKLQQVMAEHLQADQQPEVEIERQRKRERRLQNQIERLNEFLAQNKPKRGSNGKEIQSNAVDNDSVKMPSSHGVIQGYNAQALVDSKHQIILVAEAFASQDHDNLEPMLAGVKDNLRAIGKDGTYFAGKQLTADSNYHSLRSLTVCQREQLDAYIPDICFRSRDPRFAERDRFQDGLHGRQRPAAKPDIFTLSDFSFDPLTQTYRCPNGKHLTLHARNQINRYRTYDVYHARPADCAACPLRSRCLSKASASRRYLSVPIFQPPNLIDAMKAKIDSPPGRKIYAGRLRIVEPVFANICFHKRMNRFTLRTKPKVDVQWRLYAMVHNIGTIHAFGRLNEPSQIGKWRGYNPNTVKKSLRPAAQLGKRDFFDSLVGRFPCRIK